jgi:hypothetical protein
VHCPRSQPKKRFIESYPPLDFSLKSCSTLGESRMGTKQNQPMG